MEKTAKSRLFLAPKELSQTARKFVAFYRMSKESYLELTRIVRPFVEKMDTNMRKCVPTAERILITLRMSKESYLELRRICVRSSKNGHKYEKMCAYSRKNIDHFEAI
ncbi:uncharacterized protein LOC136038948 [Artemia franciscana]|uniref:uncharacterized protein LOC136038948 n=1 Tax=Artemia franciscana TaxID=6661 RepID=UPI0032DBD27F